jgi:hypothetical protein
MNDEANTRLIDHDPAMLLPFSKRITPEDPEVTELPKAIVPNHPALYGENYS